MSQTETRRGYTIEILADEGSNIPEFSELATQGGANKAVTDALQSTGQLLIVDDKPIPFTKSAEGYNIYYMPAQSSLLEAARMFIDTQPEKSQ